MSESQDTDYGAGCGIFILLGGTLVFWIGYSGIGTGTRPIGTIMSMVFGPVIALVGLREIVVDIIKRKR